MNILGLDPGKVNFAYSVMNLHNECATVIIVGYFEEELKNFIDEPTQDTLRRFVEKVREVCNTYAIGKIVIERMMPRQVSRPSAIDKIGIITGALMVAFPEVKLLTPAAWKTSLKRNKFPQGSESKHFFPKMSEHQADASCIAIYGHVGNFGVFNRTVGGLNDTGTGTEGEKM